jgi:superfamily II DNA or RNA helicase
MLKKAMELTMDDVHERFDWIDSGLKQLRDGGCRRLLHMEPGDAFWGLWSDCKDDLKRMGLSPRKDGKWTVNWWMRLEDWYALTACNGKRPRVSRKGLLPYQPAHVADLVASIKQFGGALDGSDLGTGKTSCALAVARELQKPVFVVCPAKSPINWRYWSERMGVPLIGAAGYERLKTGNTEYLERTDETVRKKGKDVRETSYRWALEENALIVFDEVHRCGGRDTLESKLLLQAARQGHARLGLSGTVMDTPMRARALGPAFGLFEDGDFYA